VESLYEVPDTWASSDRLRPILDRRYAAFVKKARGEVEAPKKPAKKKPAKRPAKKRPARKARR
jgi:hypothetical protein